MSHAISSIVRDEGFRALYFGIKPAIFRQATYGTIKFGIYYRLKSMIMGSGKVKFRLFCKPFVYESCLLNYMVPYVMTFASYFLSRPRIS